MTNHFNIIDDQKDHLQKLKMIPLFSSQTDCRIMTGPFLFQGTRSDVDTWIYSLNGKAFVKNETTQVDLKTDDCTIIPPNKSFSIEIHDSETRIMVVSMGVPERKIADVGDEDGHITDEEMLSDFDEYEE